MVLLDLIGAANPVFYNTFRETNDLFERLQMIGKCLSLWTSFLQTGDLLCEAFMKCNQAPYLGEPGY